MPSLRHAVNALYNEVLELRKELRQNQNVISFPTPEKTNIEYNFLDSFFVPFEGMKAKGQKTLYNHIRYEFKKNREKYPQLAAIKLEKVRENGKWGWRVTPILV